MPALVALCGSVLAQHVSAENASECLRLCEQYGLRRLEAHCHAVVARELDDVLAREPPVAAPAATGGTFGALVRESAAAIERREATDSIPLVDEIRREIHRACNPDSDSDDESADAAAQLSWVREERRRLRLLDAFVEGLGLSG